MNVNNSERDDVGNDVGNDGRDSKRDDVRESERDDVRTKSDLHLPNKLPSDSLNNSPNIQAHMPTQAQVQKQEHEHAKTQTQAQQLAQTQSSTQAHTKCSWSLVVIVALVMFCEGFDLIAYSSVLPSLIQDTSMGVNKVIGGAIGSITFLGMFVGGIFAGKVNNFWGHTKTICLGIIWFSLAMFLGAISLNLYVLGASRALAGLGLGVVLPVALSFARGQCKQSQSAFVISLVMSGVPLGGFAAAASTSLILALSGWRMIMVVAGVIGLALVLATYSKLAKGEAKQISAAKISAKTNATANAKICNETNGELYKELCREVSTSTTKQEAEDAQCSRFSLRAFGKTGRLLLLLLALATFMFLMAYYGISTWLVQLMREFNIPLDNSLQLMMTLNLGCVLGSLLTARVAGKLGVNLVAISCALLAAVSLSAIALRIDNPILLFCLVFCAGVGAISAQNLTNTLVSNAFASHIRTGALGFTLGVGRLGAVASPVIGGALLQIGLDAAVVLLFLAVADLLGIILLLLCIKPLRKQVCENSA
ncbi:MAG: MFS transporter [Coriobacteriales bacterium]|jgi:AAHS family benzoate transporter-like MFS transporter|nr:MFS transporter [Coriobacteriales bacterium]